MKKILFAASVQNEPDEIPDSFPPLQKSVLPVPSSEPDDGLPSAESALQIFPVL